MLWGLSASVPCHRFCIIMEIDDAQCWTVSMSVSGACVCIIEPLSMKADAHRSLCIIKPLLCRSNKYICHTILSGTQGATSDLLQEHASSPCEQHPLSRQSSQEITLPVIHEQVNGYGMCVLSTTMSRCTGNSPGIGMQGG